MTFAVWGWAAILAVVIAVELILWRLEKPLLTDFVRKSRWIAAPLLLFIGMLIGHFFWCECF